MNDAGAAAGQGATNLQTKMITYVQVGHPFPYSPTRNTSQIKLQLIPTTTTVQDAATMFNVISLEVDQQQEDFRFHDGENPRRTPHQQMNTAAAHQIAPPGRLSDGVDSIW